MAILAEQVPGIAGLRVVTADRYRDARGFFSETYNAEAFAAAGIKARFIQDNHSRSEANVLRGLHFQVPPFAQAKLIRVVRGHIVDVAVDLRRGSPSYGRHAIVELSEEDWRQLYVPVGFAHGFLTLSAGTEILYKVNAPYSPEHEAGIRWNDPDLRIAWPDTDGEFTLSDKDRGLGLFRDFDSPFIDDESSR